MSVIGTNDIDISVLDQVDEASSHVTSTNHWLRLSDEIVLLIFRQLPLKDLVTASVVDKRFLCLSRDGSLWTELTLDYEDFLYQQNANNCRHLVERCNKLSSLKITNDSDIRSSLDIMSVIVRARETLKSLDLDDDWNPIHWTSVALALLGDMRELRSLALRVEIKHRSEGLEDIGKLAQLEVLKINVEFRGEEDLEITKNIFLQLRKLKVVEISHANDAVVIAIASNNRDLKSLSIIECCDVLDKGISALADSCPDLEELMMNDICSIGALNKLSSSCNKMKCFQIRGIHYEETYDIIDDETFIKEIGQFTSLESLSLGICHKVTKNCCDHEDQEHEVTDHGVETAVKAVRRLKNLHIEYDSRYEVLAQRLRTKNPELELFIHAW